MQAVQPNKKRRSSINFVSIASYFGVFMMIISLVALSYSSPRRMQQVNTITAGTNQEPGADMPEASVDQLVATGVAARLAEKANLPVMNNVANLNQSLAVESLLAQTDTTMVTKPQIVQPTATNRSVTEYIAKQGDTIPSVAALHGLTAQTVKWANNLTSDALEPGKVVKIPPVDGVLYTVKNGDSVDTVTTKYKANRASFIALNDLELGGLTPGRQVIVPQGELPEAERPGYVAPRARTTWGGGTGIGSSGNYMAMSAGNKYAWGNCTWYAYERRVQLGLPVGSFWGNASSWAYAASAAGLRVSSEPSVGAIMQNGGGYGHVAIVEGIVPGVSVTISEMNGYRWGGGFNRIGTGTLSWSEAVNPTYRYIHGN